MATTHSTDMLAQVVIILAFLSVFLTHFSLIRIVLISLLLFSLLLFSFLLSTLINLQSILKINLRSQKIISLGTLVLSILILLTLIFGMIFYYFNYESGLLYSLLLLLATVAIIQSFLKLSIIPANNPEQVLVFGLVVSFYTTMMVLGAVYDLSILMIPLSNPLAFILGLLFKIPVRFIGFVLQYFSTTPLLEFFFLIFLPFLVLLGVFTTVFNLVWRRAEKNAISVHYFDPQIHSISKFPFVMIIAFFAISQVATGLTEFLISSFWLLLVIQLLLLVFCFGKEKNSDIVRLQLTILLWILVLGFIKELYYNILKIPPLQVLMSVTFIDQTLVQTIWFLILNSIVFVVLYVLILKISDQEQERMIIRANFLGLVVLLLFIQSMLVKLLLTSVLVIIYSFSKFQQRNLRNSKNINKAQIKKNLLQVSTEFSIILLSFLII